MAKDIIGLRKAANHLARGEDWTLEWQTAIARPLLYIISWLETVWRQPSRISSHCPLRQQALWIQCSFKIQLLPCWLASEVARSMKLNLHIVLQVWEWGSQQRSQNAPSSDSMPLEDSRSWTKWAHLPQGETLWHWLCRQLTDTETFTKPPFNLLALWFFFFNL